MSGVEELVAYFAGSAGAGAAAGGAGAATATGASIAGTVATAAATSLITQGIASALAKKPADVKAPTLTAPTPAPDPNSPAAKRASIVSQLERQGRASTILTNTSDTLGA